MEKIITQRGAMKNGVQVKMNGSVRLADKHSEQLGKFDFNS